MVQGWFSAEHRSPESRERTVIRASDSSLYNSRLNRDPGADLLRSPGLLRSWTDNCDAVHLLLVRGIRDLRVEAMQRWHP
jgi:hypothetical protein